MQYWKLNGIKNSTGTCNSRTAFISVMLVGLCGVPDRSVFIRVIKKIKRQQQLVFTIYDSYGSN